jgi:hypothetical protein
MSRLPDKTTSEATDSLSDFFNSELKRGSLISRRTT